MQLELDDTTLYYEDSGAGSTGETIAFAHGLLWRTELFAPQIAALRARYRCIAWDHRGQGRSAADRRHCIDMELVAKDAIAVIERVARGPVHFVGLSMGGFVAMRVAARRPELVKSLVLLETSADPEPNENLAKYRVLSAISRAIGPKPLRGRIAPIMFGRTILGDRARRDELAGYLEILGSRRDAWRAVNGVIDRAGVRDELARIRAPTLVVVGDEDLATPPVRAERIAAAIAGARLATIAGAGHSSPVEQPDAVTSTIASFLHGVR